MSEAVMKHCTKCGIEKPEDEFEMQPTRGRRRAECQECRRKYNKAYYAMRKSNPLPVPPKPETKKCNHCQETKPISDFSTAGPRRIRGKCKSCQVAINRERRKEQYKNDPTRSHYRPFENEHGIIVKRCTRCYTEKPISDFYTNSVNNTSELHSRCKECDKAMKKDRYDANPEKFRAEARNYHQRNPQKHRASFQAWVQRNREYVLSRYRKYNEANREERNQSARFRRANMAPDARKLYYAHYNFTRRARHANVLRERIDRQALIERDNWTCYLCGCVCTYQNVTLDHIVPLSKGGPHTSENLRVACVSCNSSKGSKDLSDFLRWKGA